MSTEPPPVPRSPATPAEPGAACDTPSGDTKAPETTASTAGPPPRPKEIGGPPGPEPTRYGDWQFNGRVTDF